MTDGTRFSDIAADPARFDFFWVMRRLERASAPHPRIGTSASRRQDRVLPEHAPWLAFPASTLAAFHVDPHGRPHVRVRFLGLASPQGPLPLDITDETLTFERERDEALSRFLDILNGRFLQLFYRAWGASRPIVHQERPEEDRFAAWIGSLIGLAEPGARNRTAIDDRLKLAHAGLMAAPSLSATRLEALFLGLLGLSVHVDEFIGDRLTLEPGEQTRLGQSACALGREALLGARVFTPGSRIRIRIVTPTLADYERLLPTGDLAGPVSDLMRSAVGDALAWDIELALPARETRPVRPGAFGRLGWTGWLAPPDDGADTLRRDARFSPAARHRPDDPHHRPDDPRPRSASAPEPGSAS